MNTLLIFFAFPIAVIIVSIILEKLLESPIAVASLIFAIFIVVTFAAFDETFLIATLAYTIISLITALIVHLLKRKDNRSKLCEIIAELLRNNANNGDDDDGDSDTIEELLNNNINNNSNNNNCGCGCNRYRRR